MTTTTTIDGQLEIDHDRGVIYFHANKEYVKRHKVITLLRICKIPVPIPKHQQIDLTIEYSKAEADQAMRDLVTD